MLRRTAIAAALSSTLSAALVIAPTTATTAAAAAVKVVNEAANTVVDLFTDAQGAYRVETATPGAYRVEVTLDGFEPAVRRVTIVAGQSPAADVTLVPARLTWNS